MEDVSKSVTEDLIKPPTLVESNKISAEQQKKNYPIIGLNEISLMNREQ